MWGLGEPDDSEAFYYDRLDAADEARQKERDLKRETMEKQKYYMKQREAILNDKDRKSLFSELAELYTNALPEAYKKDDGTFDVRFSDDTEKLADKIKEQIDLLEKQILNSFN